MAETMRLVTADQRNRDEARQRIIDALEFYRCKAEAGLLDGVVIVGIGPEAADWSIKTAEVSTLRLVGALAMASHKVLAGEGL